MKKTKLVLAIALLGIQFAANAQTLEIVNNRTCAIIVDVNLNGGGCFGTSTCSLPTGGAYKFIVPPMSTTGPMPTTTAANMVAAFGSYFCSPGTYEYVRASIQYVPECDICGGGGGGVTVGEPCVILSGFGPTCYPGSDCSIMPCAVMTRPPGFGPGGALITAY